jgi:hypothetical protein
VGGGAEVPPASPGLRHFLRLFSETMYVPQYEITSVDLDYEDGRKLLTTLGGHSPGSPMVRAAGQPSQ